jgi:hypothetical protein
MFFICCCSSDAWDLILKAAQAAGPITIHGCACILHPFPKADARLTFIQGANLLSQQIKEMVHLTTDRLRLPTVSDEEELLAQTPHAVALIPRFVDHSPQAVCHTIVFLPTPDTICFTNETLHLACIPPKLLAPLPPPTHLSTATTALPTPATTTSPDLLNAIFAQWNTPPAPTPPPKPTPPPSRKRPCTGSETSTVGSSQGDHPDNAIDLSKDDSDDASSSSSYNTDDEEHLKPTASDTGSTNSSTSMPNATHEDSATLLSHDELDDLDYPLSQTAAVDYKLLQFHVESHCPERMPEHLILERHFKTTHGDPADLRRRINSWNPTLNEQ